jgi:hypothetical protein
MTEQQRLAAIAQAAQRVRSRDAAAEPQKRLRSMHELKRGEHALTNYLARKIKGDGTHAPAQQPWQAYEAAKRNWQAANPGATVEQYEAAMRAIAGRFGL